MRSGFDSNIVADNHLEPNEFQKYKILYDPRKVFSPLTVTYKVYYLRKGGSGVYEDLTGDDGLLKEESDFATQVDWLAYQKKLKKAAIFEVFSKDVMINRGLEYCVSKTGPSPSGEGLFLFGDKCSTHAAIV